MPSPRYIEAPQSNNWMGETLKSFIGDQTEKLKERQESDVLQDIFGQYQQDGENLEKIILDVQSRYGLSPTTRVNTLKQLNQFHKHNKEVQSKIKEDIKKQEDKKRVADSLKKSGATEDQISLYEASPVGGQTRIVEDIIESKNRSQKPAGFEREDILDYDAGLTPKERVKRQDSRFNLQTPLVNKNSEGLRGLQNEQTSLKLLKNLDETGKIGQGINKLNINPKTGDLFIPQFASAEEQLFVKTVNDFTVKAKDSFGARVTNFELDRFMQRLPTLANSKEGRKLIIDHMIIVNKAQELEKKALQEVFDKYGVRNIDFVDAEKLARESISNELQELRQQAEQVEVESRNLEQSQIEKIKNKVKTGYVPMRKPDGTIKQFPEKNVSSLEDKGYERI